MTSKSQNSRSVTKTDSSNLFPDIQEILGKVAFGDVTFQIKRVNDRNHQLIASYYDHVRYKDNAEATSAIINLLVALAKAEYQGAYTFTVNYKSGSIKEVIYEGLEQKNYG